MSFIEYKIKYFQEYIHYLSRMLKHPKDFHPEKYQLILTAKINALGHMDKLIQQYKEHKE